MLVTLPPVCDDPVHSLVIAVLNQALADLDRFTPSFIAELETKFNEAKTRGSYIKLQRRIFEARTERADIVEWVGSKDFITLVEWAGLNPADVERVFRFVIQSQEQEGS